MGRRKMPARLKELRDRDPNAFIRACRRGGRNSAKSRAVRQTEPRANQLLEDYRSLVENLAEEARLRAARIAANERRDHLIPEDDR